MRKRRVLIEIGPGRLSLSVLRGGRVLRSQVFRDEGNWGDDWPGMIKAFQGPLGEMVARMEVSGAAAVVLYWSPAIVCGVYSCAKSAGASKAGTAAKLALAESADFPLRVNPHIVMHLATDGASAGDGGQIHTLGAADLDAHAEAVASLARSAGLEPEVLAPLDVPAVVHAAEDVLARSRDGVAVALHIGEHGSVLAGAARGKMKFLRQIAIGGDSLGAALTREIRREDGTSLVLDAATARTLFWTRGVPAREQLFDAERGLTGAAVLPLIQPVLQRWLVEIKQSLRFGFEDSERAEAELAGHGAGAAIPRLLEVIAAQCGLRVGDAPDDAAECNARWASDCGHRVNLLPVNVMQQRTRTRLTRGLGVGVAVAGLVIAGEAVLTRAELSQQRRQNQQLETRLTAASPGVQLRDEAMALRAGLNAAKQRMAERLTPNVRWDSALVLVARATPERVRLSDIRMSVDGSTPVCRIVGEAPAAVSNEVLKSYLDTLAAAPLVRDCRMGATQRTDGQQGGVQQFEMSVLLVDLPGGTRSPARLASWGAEEVGDGQ